MKLRSEPGLEAIESAPGRSGRRAALGAALAGGAAGLGCAIAPALAPAPSVTAVAYPARDLAYAPLLLALGRGPFAPPGTPVAPLLRGSGAGVAAAVVEGEAVAGALPLPDLVAAVAEGAPLVAFGALTRRAAGQLVVARDAPLPPSAAALLDGQWRGARVGLTTGRGASEDLMRFWWLAGAAPGGTGDGAPSAPYLQRDPWRNEPRWIGFSTAEGLVAALKDGRVWAFLGPSQAAAQAVLLAAGEVVANVSDGSAAAGVSAALPVVLVARRDRLAVQRAGGQPLLASLAAACGRAGAALHAAGGQALAALALPERDALVLGGSLRLDTAGGATAAPGLYAVDGRLHPGAVDRYLELAAGAGAGLTLTAPALVAG